MQDACQRLGGACTSHQHQLHAHHHKHTNQRFFLRSENTGLRSLALRPSLGNAGELYAERDLRGFAVTSSTPRQEMGTSTETILHSFSFAILYVSLSNHAINVIPHGLRSAQNNWDFWTLLPEALHQVTVVMSDCGIPKSFLHMHSSESHLLPDRCRKQAHLGKVPLPHAARD